ncbi:hypothetical protein PVAP13_9KG034281 [Panicum virgatum]|uniref:Protein FAR1-RELATED SEQUENCE n=1 Tax=Panicum virgatum TaxID=38727 RepID=A0A8T0NAJ4_PANVG|nr:hypothetical protein PVAP13_9KG034281 [Panicum virgatum]
MVARGQAFSTKQEAREFYNSYAKRIGFSIRTSTTRLSGVTREQNKVHNFDGDSDPNDCDEGAEKKKKLDGGKKRKMEKMMHTDCKAKMVVKLIAGKWHVINFVPDHNHDLVLKPSLKKFLRSHKGTPKEEKDFIALLHGCNLSTGCIMQLMNEFYGYAQLVPYEGKDVDGAARRAYIELYNDLMSFDATYMTNMYDMPFAPFIGINKHGQSFMLRCGFIRDEKNPSYLSGAPNHGTRHYLWLFETFLEAMQGKAPVSIITDQDGAMRCAIAQTFPNTNHRNCRWHIMDKFTGTIGPILDKDEKLEDDFKECMNYTVSPDEFEAKWSAMISKYNLQENVHFQRLYAIRSSFGFNAVLKKYVNPNMSVLHFVRQYQKIQDKCLVAQDGQDFRTDDKERRRWSRYPIEKHASTVYTKNLFYRFSKEFEKTAEYDVTSEGQFQYLLVPNNKFVYGYGKRTYLVMAVVEEECYYCECSKFDRDGMLCCHIMKILTRLGVKNIPQRYILKRWTQEAIQGDGNAKPNAHVPAEFIARGMPLNSKRTLWFTNLSTAFASLAVEGCVSKETYTVMDNHIKLMQAEIAEIKQREKKAMLERRGALIEQGDAPVTIYGDFDGASAMTAGVGNPPRSKSRGTRRRKGLKKDECWIKKKEQVQPLQKH